MLIQDYDPAWPDGFLKLAARVRAALGTLVVAIEHIGSTAVPSLAAKPIIDLDVVLTSPANLPEVIRLLAILGYAHEGDLGVAGREAFRSPAGEVRHHLYVLAAGANELYRHVAVRAALRCAPIGICGISTARSSDRSPTNTKTIDTRTQTLNQPSSARS